MKKFLNIYKICILFIIFVSFCQKYDAQENNLLIGHFNDIYTFSETTNSTHSLLSCYFPSMYYYGQIKSMVYNELLNSLYFLTNAPNSIYKLIMKDFKPTALTLVYQIEYEFSWSEMVIDFKSGYIYIANLNMPCLLRLNLDGSNKQSFSFNIPSISIVLDKNLSYLYLMNKYNGIFKISTNIYSTSYDLFLHTPGINAVYTGLTIDYEKNFMYVGDATNKVIYTVDFDRSFTFSSFGIDLSEQSYFRYISKKLYIVDLQTKFLKIYRTSNSSTKIEINPLKVTLNIYASCIDYIPLKENLEKKILQPLEIIGIVLGLAALIIIIINIIICWRCYLSGKISTNPALNPETADNIQIIGPAGLNRENQSISMNDIIRNFKSDEILYEEPNYDY